MNFIEKCGFLAGYPLGLITGTVSFLRAARMFHPTGILALGEVEVMKKDFMRLHPYVMVRFTSAIWKYKNLPDVLGLTLRFSEQKNFTTRPLKNDQDLLFASFPHPWQTPIGPFLTNYKNFFANSYYAVSPFSVQGRTYIFKVTANNSAEERNKRDKIIRQHIQEEDTIYLWTKSGKEPWVEVARIKLKEELFLDQEDLFFNPFLNGLNICPTGFIHHLRIGAYRLSQLGRTLRHSLQKVLHHSNKGFIIHRF